LVTALRAPVLEPLPEALGTSSLTPSESADFWFDTRSEIAPRQGVWALVELADPAKPTIVRWNDGKWLQVQRSICVSNSGPTTGPGLTSDHQFLRPDHCFRVSYQRSLQALPTPGGRTPARRPMREG
jgi:hypothetical protein